VLVSKTESKSALDNLARCICAFSAFEDLSGLFEKKIKFVWNFFKR